MLSPQGRVLGQYAKVLIVPFGEYLPLRPLLRWTERLGMPSEDLLAGKQWTPLSWTRGRVGVSICFESAFGAVSRAHVRQGANLLAVLTSDGWAGRKAAGLQHASFAPLRAVETRRSVARAAATGVSQLIDPYGRPHRALPMFTKGVAVVDLPLRSDLTPFVQLGDWPVGLSWLLLAGLPLARALAGRRRPRRVA
jgi:apolipoprotein N-acyltransferase